MGTVTCFYLMIEPFYQFSVEKRTFTIETKHHMNVENFPVFTVCPVPEFNFSMTKVNGYGNSYAYNSGILNWGKNEVSWIGNTSKTVGSILDELAILKSNKHCPLSEFSYLASFKNGAKVYTSPIKFKLTRALFPDFRCCKSVFPNITRIQTIKSVRFLIKRKKAFPYDSFKVYVNEQFSSFPLNVLGAQLIGNKIETKDMDGYMNYVVSAHEKEHIEGDPNYKCKIYHRIGGYEKCLEEQIVLKSHSFVGCAAPWMTSNKVPKFSSACHKRAHRHRQDRHF